MNRWVRFSHEFSDDIDEIWFYIAQDNVEAANHFIDGFEPIYDILAHNPYAGRSRDELKVGLRSFPHESYIIFYFPADYGVLIYRVFHAARDIELIFTEEFE